MAPRPFPFLAHVAMLLAESTAAENDTHFPGSRIILNNTTWGAAVNTWANKSAAQVWSRCYSSLTDNHDTPAAFHAQCDQHNITAVFARNSIGNVFGGYAAGTWNITACCAANQQHCSPGQYCQDRTASSDFIFRLQPGDPERFLPKGATTVGTRYQLAGPVYWPVWGDSPADLNIGNSGPPGHKGYCNHGGTYAGSTNATCGGGGNWGPTDLEVWFPGPAGGAPPPPAPGPAVTCNPKSSPPENCPSGKVCPACGKVSCPCPKDATAATVDV